MRKIYEIFKDKRCLVPAVIFFFLLFIYLWDYYKIFYNFLGIIHLIVLVIFSILSSLNIGCISCTIRDSLKGIKNKSSILSIVLTILGLLSVQGCVALFCNPGIFLSVFIIIFPTILPHNLEIISLVILYLSTLLLFLIMWHSKCFHKVYSFKLSKKIG